MPNATETENTIQNLIKHVEPSSLSILMPTHERWSDRPQDPIRFKNLIQAARQEMGNIGLSEDEIDRRCRPLQKILTDEDFWLQPKGGFATYVASGQGMIHKWPGTKVEELVVVGERFHLKPFLTDLTSGVRIAILVLSQDSARLLQADMRHIREISLASHAPRVEEVVEQHLDFHTGTPKTGEGQRRAAVFHGQGGGDDTARKARLTELCKSLDRSVTGLIDDKTPLFLAGHEPMPGIFRSTSTIRSLQPEVLPGTLEQMTPKEVQAQALDLLSKLNRQVQEEDLKRYQQQAGGHLAGHDMREVLTATHFGRVDTIFVASDRAVWGRFKPKEEAITTHSEREPGDEDLLNVAALNTLRNGGKVHVLPNDKLPGESLITALFRFPRTG